MYNKVKTQKEIEAIRESGRMLSSVLSKIEEVLVPGMTGIEIDELTNNMLKEMGGVAAFLGYQGFPNSICISVNDAVVHGIPNNVPFKSGDIVGFDFGVIYQGMITDAARTYIVGETTKEIEKLVTATKRSLDNAINKVKTGCSVGDIANAAQTVLDNVDPYNIASTTSGPVFGIQADGDETIPNSVAAIPTAGTEPLFKKLSLVNTALNSSGDKLASYFDKSSSEAEHSTVISQQNAGDAAANAEMTSQIVQFTLSQGTGIASVTAGLLDASK